MVKSALALLAMLTVLACGGGTSDVAEQPSSLPRHPADTTTAEVRPSLPAIKGSSRVPRDTVPYFQPDSPRFQWQQRAGLLRTAIPFTFRNPLPDTLYIVHCKRDLDMMLERETASGWKGYWAPVLRQCLSRPIVIEPGALYHDTLRVSGSRPGANIQPSFASADVEGMYRLRWNNLVTHYRPYDPATRSFGDSLPLALRTSDPFFIQAPGGR